MCLETCLSMLTACDCIQVCERSTAGSVCVCVSVFFFNGCVRDAQSSSLRMCEQASPASTLPSLRRITQTVAEAWSSCPVRLSAQHVIKPAASHPSCRRRGSARPFCLILAGTVVLAGCPFTEDWLSRAMPPPSNTPPPPVEEEILCYAT